jgi:hypothetical protein
MPKIGQDRFSIPDKPSHGRLNRSRSKRLGRAVRARRRSSPPVRSSLQPNGTMERSVVILPPGWSPRGLTACLALFFDPGALTQARLRKCEDIGLAIDQRGVWASNNWS